MIAIVGAGAAGAAAAVELRAAGYTGQVRLFGSEPVAPYERPTLSKGFLSEEEFDSPPTLLADRSCARDIELELGTTIAMIDRESRLIEATDGRQFSYDRLLLATGARCRRLQIPGSDLAGVHYLREIADARRLRAELRRDRHVVVIGGGVIGLEVASSARRRGCEVTVVEAAPQVMSRVVLPELAELIADLHRARGVDIQTTARPVEFASVGRFVAGAVLDSDKVVSGDTVVVGIGADPRTELATAAGLAVDNGVLVDEYLNSSDDRILAAGDVASVSHAAESRRLRIEQWWPAQEQGRHAARCIVGPPKPYRDTPRMWSDQHEFHVQACGFGFDDTEVIRRGGLDQREGLAYFGAREGRLVAACGVSLGDGVARTIHASRVLIDARVPVDLELLGDPHQDVRRLAQRLAKRKQHEFVER